MDIPEQEEYVNLQAQYISSVTIETASAEIKQEEGPGPDDFDKEQEAQEIAHMEKLTKAELSALE